MTIVLNDIKLIISVAPILRVNKLKSWVDHSNTQPFTRYPYNTITAILLVIAVIA